MSTSSRSDGPPRAGNSCAYDEGAIDMRAVVDVLKEIGYQGALSVEHEPRDHDPMPAVVRSAAQLRGWL